MKHAVDSICETSSICPFQLPNPADKEDKEKQVYDCHSLSNYLCLYFVTLNHDIRWTIIFV